MRRELEATIATRCAHAAPLRLRADLNRPGDGQPVGSDVISSTSRRAAEDSCLLCHRLVYSSILA